MGGQRTGLYRTPSPITPTPKSPMPQFPKFGYGGRLGSQPKPQPYDITALPNYNPALPFSGLTPEQQTDFSNSSSNYQYGFPEDGMNNPKFPIIKPDISQKQPIQPIMPQPVMPPSKLLPPDSYAQRKPTPVPFNPYDRGDSDVGNPIVPQPKMGLPKFPQPFQQPRAELQPITPFDEYRRYLQ